MPKMTGLQLAARLTELRPDLPIIISSGREDDFGEDVLGEAGIRCFLPKPTRLSRVVEVIRQSIANRDT
jgi:FixJ family two-component response regulator